MTAPQRICIIHPNPGPECETFIRAHAERLQSVVEVLYGGHMPLFRKDGSTLHPDLPADAARLFSPSGAVENEMHEQATETMADFLRDNHIDAVLAEYGPTGVAMLEPCRRADVPLVTHFHGFDASLKPVLAKYREGYARLFGNAAAIVAVSLEMRRDLLHLGASEDRLHVNPYGVDASLFDSATPADAAPRFISVGRFVDKKAPETVVCAFAEVARMIPEASLRMIGDGVLRESAMRLARNLGLSDRIDFPGNLPHEEVAEAMRAARCFVQHSVTPETGDKEGTPNSVLEASASGLPVVSTRHAGIREAVVHETTGLLCEEGELDAMTENMLRMARDPQLAALYGQAGREHVRTNYDFATQLGRLEAIVAEATRSGGAHG
ncbi:glycosyltransferase [Desulfovibrio oxyclinae]|uniref:glycosyltransferase n=1 Tax=Desulfovibrio oxyclinae TaxID=63560 RepID=UPI000372EA41|nr:glycosyltransferase [Desulfovibrio oxyclinae]